MQAEKQEEVRKVVPQSRSNSRNSSHSSRLFLVRKLKIKNSFKKEHERFEGSEESELMPMHESQRLNTEKWIDGNIPLDYNREKNEDKQSALMVKEKQKLRVVTRNRKRILLPQTTINCAK